MKLTKKQKKNIIIFIIFIVLTLTGYYKVQDFNSQEKYQVTLEKCVDGDTAVFKVNNESKKFRFLAVDTPESVHPTKKVESFGKEASEYTCELLTNATLITIEYDPNSDKTDKYERSLGWIWVDNNLLQEELIKKGYAEVAYIYGDYKYTNELCKVQKQAKEKKLGIWQNTNRKEGYCNK